MITVFQWFFKIETLTQICYQSAVFMLTRHRALTISTAKKCLVSRGMRTAAIGECKSGRRLSNKLTIERRAASEVKTSSMQNVKLCMRLK